LKNEQEKIMNATQMPEFKNVNSVRIVEWRNEYNYNQVTEVNEAIKLGWQLLLVQTGEVHPLFVLGWVGPETAPQTEWQKKSAKQTEQMLKAMRQAVV
jgi:hypothetical protein